MTLTDIDGGRTMILITGGLGFIGSHTARALLDLGETCVLAQRREPGPNPLLGEEIGKRAVVERLDISDIRALLDLGERHHITGVIHLAGAYGGDPIADARTEVTALLNVIEAASAWGVRRLGTASSIGVYDGDDASPLHESSPLPLSARHPIASAKKVDEILGSYLSGAVGIEIYAARIGAIWGPLGRTTSRFFAVPQLMHAAVAGTEPDLSALPDGHLPHADDGIDLMYVRECGRALALLQVADRLAHRVYNVASGRATTYRELADAISAALPGTGVALAEGREPRQAHPNVWLDISRLRQDAGYEPEYDTERAVADYVAWLRAGHER
jgi:UDP-glucose 4-epimerase